MENSALYQTQLPSIFRGILKTQKHKVFTSNLYLYIHVYGSALISKAQEVVPAEIGIEGSER